MTAPPGALDGRWVGFDLDLTLVNSRPGIEAVYRELSRRTGVPVDVDAVRIGPPLEDELRKWFPEQQVTEAANTYRAIYADYAIESSPPMPGAHEALAAVRSRGGQIVVISSKYQPNVLMHVEQCKFDVDEVVGWAFGDGKRDALLTRTAVAYAGDFEADMRAAVAAGAVAIGVTTGPNTAEELYAAGADMVLAGLGEFESLLASLVSDSRLGVAPSSR